MTQWPLQQLRREKKTPFEFESTVHGVGFIYVQYMKRCGKRKMLFNKFIATNLTICTKEMFGAYYRRNRLEEQLSIDYNSLV